MFRFCASSTALASKAPEASSIAATAQTNGHVRVIVLLNAPNIANQARPDAATIAAARAQVAGLQDTVLANHFGDATNLRPGRGFTRRHARFAITPGFVIDVDAAELEALASDPLVKTINIDHARPPTLLQSLPLIGQPTAYSNGATGAGWAVAVLDTGVQSNHEFLSGKVVAEACFSNAAGGGGGVSLCPNGQNSQTGTGAANSTTANCINSTTNLCQHGTHVSGIAAGLNTSPQRAGRRTASPATARFSPSRSSPATMIPRTAAPATPPCVLSWDSDQVSALDYVYQHLTPVTGVNVASINMSLGGGPNTSTACDSDIQKTRDRQFARGRRAHRNRRRQRRFQDADQPSRLHLERGRGRIDDQRRRRLLVLQHGDHRRAARARRIWRRFLHLRRQQSGYPFVVPRHFQRNDKLSMPAKRAPRWPRRTWRAPLRPCAPPVPHATASAILSAFQSSGLAITDTRSGAPGNITKSRIRLDAALAALNCGAGGSLAVSPRRI